MDYRAADTEAEIFWDLPDYAHPGCLSEVYLGGIKKGETAKTHFSLTDLDPDSTYEAEVIFKTSEYPARSLGKLTLHTLPTKKRIDITLPPYNAVGDGITINTKAIQKALDDCDESSCVYIPEGTFLSGALDMHSGTELFVSKKALLQGTADPAD